MPIITEKSIIHNNNEIETAIRASDAVKDGQTIHFPLVYGAAHCEPVHYDSGSSFAKPSINWAIRKKIVEEYGRRGGILFDKNTHHMSLKDKITYMQEKIPSVTKNLVTEANVLLSELAWSDLETFMVENKDKSNINDLVGMYSVLIDVVLDMQNLLDIVHNDFHLGNVLLYPVTGGSILLAHDFGNATPLTQRDHTTDILMITDKLYERHFQGLEFGALLNHMSKYYLSCENCTMEDAKKEWSRISGDVHLTEN